MDDKTARYIVEISNLEGKYSGKVFKNRLDDIACWGIDNLPIGSDALLKIDKKEFGLSELVGRIFSTKLDDPDDFLKKVGQLEFEIYLFAKFLAHIPDGERTLLKGEGNEI